MSKPIFNCEGVNYFYIYNNELYFVLTSLDDGEVTYNGPSYTLELLNKLAQTMKDFFGILNEESFRRNIILAYEVLDEVLSWGYPQATAVDELRPLVHTEPEPIDDLLGGVSAAIAQKKKVPALTLDGKGSAGGISVDKVERKVNEVIDFISAGVGATMSIAKSARSAGASEASNEVFVDLIERLSVVFNKKGECAACEVTGTLTIRNYLFGEPVVFVSLIDDAGTTAKDCNFHSCVATDAFAQSRVLAVTPPRGETNVMCYRAPQIDGLPFRVYPFVEEAASKAKYVCTTKIHADFPPACYATNVEVSIPVPDFPGTLVFCESTAGAVEYRKEKAAVFCNFSKVQGGVDFEIRVSVTLDRPRPAARREIGPVNIAFDLPAWTATHVSVGSVSVEERGARVDCHKWVRVLTSSSSYVRRTN